MTSPAKVFEKEVKAGLERAFPTSFIYHEPDFPLFAIKSTTTRFKHSQAVDYLVLGRTINFAIEVKFIQSALFPFKNIRDTQLEFLTKFQERAGESYFVIGSKLFETHAFLFPLNTLISLKRQLNKESFNLKYDLSNINHSFYTKLNRIKIKTKYYIAFSFLIRTFNLGPNRLLIPESP
jgi:penicillin-binding protein-related factor A (putative recombinase)